MSKPANVLRKEMVLAQLQPHMKADFVQRIFAGANAPAIINEDGSASTHRMATAEAEGKHYVFPTVRRNSEGILEDFGMDSFREAFKSKEVVGPFDTAEQADWFERNWKVLWEQPARQ